MTENTNMNKAKQIIRDIKLSETLNKELNPLTKKVKEFIDYKLKGLVEFEVDNYPGVIFYKKDDIVLFKQDIKNEWLCCSMEHYWSFFDKETDLIYSETQEITKALVGTYLNCKELNPVVRVVLFDKWLSHLNPKHHIKYKYD